MNEWQGAICDTCGHVQAEGECFVFRFDEGKHYCNPCYGEWYAHQRVSEAQADVELQTLEEDGALEDLIEDAPQQLQLF